MHPDHQICFADDFSNDGTWDWLQSLDDDNITIYRNEGPFRMGLTRLYDYLIREYAIYDNLFVMHADMYVSKDLDKYIFKYLKEGTVVCATRIEPPLHPEGPEKIIQNFGFEPDSFKEDQFNEFVKQQGSEQSTTSGCFAPTTSGCFAPWAIKRKDFDSVGGHDELFAPQSREDSDLFNRLQLNKMKFVQTWQGFVYHLTSRGSRFNPNYTTIGVDSEEWKGTNARNAKNFIRKWGHMVKHDKFMKPIIPHKYDIGLVIKNCNEFILGTLEPWCSNVYVDCSIDSFLEKEQPETAFDLSEKIKPITSEYYNKIIVKFNALQMDTNGFAFIMRLPDIFESTEIGIYEFDIFILEIKSLDIYENRMIIAGNEYYRNHFKPEIINNWH